MDFIDEFFSKCLLHFETRKFVHLSLKIFMPYPKDSTLKSTWNFIFQTCQNVTVNLAVTQFGAYATSYRAEALVTNDVVWSGSRLRSRVQGKKQINKGARGAGASGPSRAMMTLTVRNCIGRLQMGINH